MTPKEISIIVALAHDRAIGRDGDQPFYISGDLRRFKQLTMGKPIIMGRKTFEALPHGALPGRRNIVVTRNQSFTAPDVETASSLDDAIALAADAPEVMVIGGGSIYAAALPRATRLLLTEIDTPVPDADTFFPFYDPADWAIDDASSWALDPCSGVKYRYICLSRK